MKNNFITQYKNNNFKPKLTILQTNGCAVQTCILQKALNKKLFQASPGNYIYFIHHKGWNVSSSPNLFSTGSTPWAGARACFSLRPSWTPLSLLSSVPFVALLSFSLDWPEKTTAEGRVVNILMKTSQKWVTTVSHIPNNKQDISCSQKKRKG